MLRFVVLAIPTLFASCSTGSGVSMTACLSDPPTQSMLCKNSGTGLETQIPWTQSGDMVCEPRGDYRYLLNAAGVGK